jgi:hypothetical protein
MKTIWRAKPACLGYAEGWRCAGTGRTREDEGAGEDTPTQAQVTVRDVATPDLRYS